jgi:putative tricarboxylic transport membrane protein
MLESFGQAIIQLSSPNVAIALVIATVGAIILGVIPGISGALAMILFLPFVYGRDPAVSMVVLATLTAVSNTGGAVTAVLLGIPGDSSNAATILDGFPLARQGEGARTVGVTIFASIAGGVLSILFAFLMIPFAIPLVMSLRSPEMFCLIIIGLSFLAVITQGSAIKGLISAGLGLLISTIGYQAKTGVARFTLGNDYLYGGVEMVVILLGILAVPVIAELVVNKESVAPVDVKSIGTYRQVLSGLDDVMRHWWLCIRSTIIGYFVGVIPGIGSETAIWVAYGHAKQTSKDPGLFGKGNMEGVIAPEAANNARAGGSMLTTLLLGIPGSSSMVMVLAAFVLVGIVPGPRVLVEHTTLCFVILLSIVVSNILAGVLCIFSLPLMLKVTQISSAKLFAYLMPIIMIGVYSNNMYTLDLLMLIPVGALGVCFRKFGYSPGAIILGFILGKLFEYYFWQSLDLFGGWFFLTPICMVLLLIVTVVFTKDLWMPLFKNVSNPFARGIK